MDLSSACSLRFILVPLGYLAAVTSARGVLVFGSWKTGSMMLSADPDLRNGSGCSASLVAGSDHGGRARLARCGCRASVGILISEAFAIRSWIFHALNGAISAWVGWQTVRRPTSRPRSR